MSELVILDEVMKRIQQKGDFAKVPKPCDYFHLIGGTSTGGSVTNLHFDPGLPRIDRCMCTPNSVAMS